MQGAVAQKEKEIFFWQQRLQQDPQNFVYLTELGGLYLNLFKLKGTIEDLKTGDSLLKTAASRLNHADPEMLHTLSQVAITQHQFKQAAEYIEEAHDNNSAPFVHALLSFDVAMELGVYREAKGALNVIKDQTSFNYLIRKAKYQDHLGDLEGAINLMEAAFANVAQTNNNPLYCWALSNLGDMYGHAGRINEAYAAYLQVLKRDPAYTYALKGIAWIAFSHDKNTKEAKRILKYIESTTQSPDVYLTLAEIAEYEAAPAEKKEYIRHFLTEATRPEYDNMYNTALIQIYTEETMNLEKAEQLALQEVQQRPTPETYSWLAWVAFKKGAVQEAYQLYNAHIKGRSFEPEVLLKAAYILEAAGKEKEAKKYFEECLASQFELGPVQYNEIKEKAR